jgi:enoyl-CoA hydratase
VNNRTQQLLSMAPQALEDMKKSLNECARGEFDHARIQVRHEASQASKDMAEALNAMAEKRTPNFTRT